MQIGLEYIRLEREGGGGGMDLRAYTELYYIKMTACQL